MSVYFVREDAPDGRIKIGYTGGNPHVRIAALQTGNPRPLRLLVAIHGEATDEASMHARFAAFRVGGEWFAPAPELLGFIDGLIAAHSGGQRFARPSDPSTLFGLTDQQVRGIVGVLRARELMDEARSIFDSARAGTLSDAQMARASHLSDDFHFLSVEDEGQTCAYAFNAGMRFMPGVCGDMANDDAEGIYLGASYRMMDVAEGVLPTAHDVPIWHGEWWDTQPRAHGADEYAVANEGVSCR